MTMPKYFLVCLDCKLVQVRLLDCGTKFSMVECKACGGKVRRTIKGPSVQVMEKLDNGSMVRAVERLADAERLSKERAKNSDPLAGGLQRSER